MEACRIMQLQLHRQQTWVKGLAMAVLALTFVALVFSYVGTDSSRIRSSGLIAFNADDPSQPNLLARHVANIKQARDAVMKKFWYWDGEDDGGPQVIIEEQPGGAATGMAAPATIWDQADQEWSEAAQIAPDDSLEGEAGTEEASRFWAPPSQPAEAAWVEPAQGSQDAWVEHNAAVDAWVTTPSEGAFQQPADAADDPWQQPAEQLWEQQQQPAAQAQEWSAGSTEEAVLVDESQEEGLDAADDGPEDSYDEDDDIDADEEEGDTAEAEGWASEAAHEEGWGSVEEAHGWQELPQDAAQQAAKTESVHPASKPAWGKLSAAEVEPEWPEQGAAVVSAAPGAETAWAEQPEGAQWDSPMQEELQLAGEWEQGADTAGSWGDGRNE